MRKIIVIIMAISGIFFPNGFGMSFSTMNPDHYQGIFNRKIFFGHQSVGFNIMDGIEKLSAGKLNIKKTRDPADFAAPVFAHAQVGRNQDPFAKIDDFKAVMDSGIGTQVDIAFFKLCYVDIEADTDLDKLFNHYRSVMDQLQTAYPQVIFVHFSVPLRTANTGLKTALKRLLGRQVWGDKENIARNYYNKKLAAVYADSGRYFDLAAFEAVSPDGKVTGCAVGGKDCLALYPGYTEDGKHLVGLGQEVIAQKLLEFLAQVK